MLETPLHHCYLVPADQPANCVPVLTKEIVAAVGDDASIETSQIDRFSIDMARQLRERGQQRSIGEVRCLIYSFNSITPEAQNALLKIIENPAAGIHFFFVTPSVQGLLETVRSRSWILHGVCETKESDQIVQLAKDFLAADGLADRLAVIDKIDSVSELRSFVRLLATKKEAKLPGDLGNSLEIVADYSQDAGASVKLLRQQLAVAASHSPDKK